MTHVRSIEAARLRLYTPDSSTGSSILWMHGGGFTGGDLDMAEADDLARDLSAAGIAVGSVDYRLAREGCRYPRQLEDVTSAWIWMNDHLAEWSGTPQKVAIGGASAGANLAAGAVMSWRGRSPWQQPRLVVLAYPTLLAEQPPPDSHLRSALDANPEFDVFGRRHLQEMYRRYTGLPARDTPLFAAPGRATVADVEGFPPTLMINDEIDELRVSGETFAETLHRAGVPVHSLTHLGTPHGDLSRPAEVSAAVSKMLIKAAIGQI